MKFANTAILLACLTAAAATPICSPIQNATSIATTHSHTKKTTSTKTKTTKSKKTSTLASSSDASEPTLVSSSVAPASTSVSSSVASASAVASAGNVAAASSSCTITTSNLSEIDTIKADCTNIVVNAVTVPAGETLDLTDLKDGTTVTFEGTTTFGYKEWEGPLLSVSGSKITVTGASGHEINGNGPKWWDGLGGNGGVTKPKFFFAHDLTGGSTIKGLNVKNTPVQGFSINGCNDLVVDSITIDNSEGDTTDGGHNTDAFDVGSSDQVTIQNSIVKNQDDCLAVNSGTNINFINNQCSGGHGISIGSIGGRTDNTVENFYAYGCTVTDSQNAVRIKGKYGKTGTVKNITYSNIKMSGITDYGIIIHNNYGASSKTAYADGVVISDVTLTDVTGTVEDDAQAIWVYTSDASGWSSSGVDVTGGKTKYSCKGIPSGAGFSC